MELVIGNQFPKKIIPLINNARRTIDLVSFDWRYYPNDPSNSVSLFNSAIFRQAKNGIVVCAVTNSPLFKSFLNSCGVFARLHRASALLHSKLIIIDDEVVVVGSHNFTSRAFNTNIELSCILQNNDLAAEAKVFFRAVYSQAV